MRNALKLILLSGAAATGGPTPLAPGPGVSILTWASAATDNEPDFDIDLPSGNIAPNGYLNAAVGDDNVIQYRLLPGGSFAEYIRHTLTAPNVAADTITIPGVDTLAGGSYEFRQRLERAATQSADWSNTVSVTIGAFEAEALAIFSAFTTPPNDTRKGHINTLVAALKTGAVSGSNIFAKLDVWYVFAGADSQASLINWKNPGTYNGTANGSPTFTADRGFAGVDASTTIYINTGFNPSTAGGNYAQNSAHISAWSLSDLTSTASGGTAIGVGEGGASQTNIIPEYSDGNAYYRINDPDGAPSAGIANSDSRGHYVANRSGASAQQGYRNAVNQSVSAGLSASLANASFAVLVYRIAPSTIVAGTAHQIAGITIGGSLTANEVTDLYNAELAYMQAVGAV